MTTPSIGQVRLPFLPLGVPPEIARVLAPLTRALFDQFVDSNTRLWSIETSLGLSPKTQADGLKIEVWGGKPTKHIAFDNSTIDIEHDEMTLSGGDAPAAIIYVGSATGSTVSNHARGFENIFTIGGCVTYDALAFNLINNGTPGFSDPPANTVPINGVANAEMGVVIGNGYATAGGSLWGMDWKMHVPLTATNGGLSHTRGVRIELDRKVFASFDSSDYAFLADNTGTVMGRGSALSANGYLMGLEILDNPAIEALGAAGSGNPTYYLSFRGAGADYNVLHATRSGQTDILLSTNTQGLKLQTGNSGFSTIASLTVTGPIVTEYGFWINNDTFMTRANAAIWQLGAADAASPVAQTLIAQNVVAGTNNVAGQVFSFGDSRSTGSAIGGGFRWRVTPAGSSGTAVNARVTAWTMDGNSFFFPGTTLATTMTTGFLNIPGAAGPPTGTPANTTGFPLYWDSTNLQLYAYTGGAWKQSAVFT